MNKTKYSQKFIYTYFRVANLFIQDSTFTNNS